MTRTANARIAGSTFLLYIVAGITSLSLTGHEGARGVLGIVTSLCALVLGVTLYALTRDEDSDLALLALGCRFIEAVPGGENRSAIFFAVGSTIFAWLFLRGRMIPVWLARFGVIASVLLVILLLVQRAGVFASAVSWSSPLTWVLWFPMLIFEVTLAFWLLIKGVAWRHAP
ncbi:MAG TPA: DUF4386 domain-containing protein [Gemmatimonadales bacterium]|nr:DUF4386 domain-containing protein [Gemmatimonadales bacterium]